MKKTLKLILRELIPSINYSRRTLWLINLIHSMEILDFNRLEIFLKDYHYLLKKWAIVKELILLLLLY